MMIKISEATLGEYLFKQWIMKDEEQVEADWISKTFAEEVIPSPENFLSLLKTSVENSIAGRKKIGLFLSGGLDSSTIACLVKKAGVEVIAGIFKYSQNAIDYEGISDDYRHAKMLCEREGIRFLTVEAEPHNLKALKELVRFMDYPIADPAIIPTYLIAKKVGQESDLMLSGHGGDEILGGYQTYRVAIKESVYSKFVPDLFLKILKRLAEYKQPHSINGKKIKFYRDLVRFSEGSLYPFPFNHECYRSYFTIDEINRLVGSEEWLDIYFEKLKRYLDFIKRKITKLQTLQFLDFYGTLNSHNLIYTKCACQAANIEVKFPFIDKKIIEYCFNLPDRMKIRGKNFKIILRESVHDFLPSEIFQRKPAGFAMPVRFWFSEEKNIDDVFNVIKSSDAKIKHYLNSNEIDEIIYEHIKRKKDNTMKLWILLTLEFFLQAR